MFIHLHIRLLNRPLKAIFLLLILFGSAAPVLAQSDSTPEFKPHFRQFPVTCIFTPDTFFQNTYFYDQGLQQDPSSAATGNPGSSIRTFATPLNEGRVRDGFEQFNFYLISPFASFQETTGDSNRTTLLDYHIGSKKEQHLMINHRQLFKHHWMAGIDFGAASSPGDFARQLKTSRNFRMWTAWEAPSRLYRFYAAFTSNRIRNQENGGLASDSIFENASSLNTRTLPIRLSNAASSLKTRDYVFNHELNLSRLFSKSVPADSVRSFTDNSFILSHSFHYLRKAVLFEADPPDSGYFDNYFLDSLTTNDSLFFGQFVNDFLLSYHLSKSNRHSIYFSTGMETEFVNYFITGSDSSYDRISALFKLGLNFPRGFAELKLKKDVKGDFNDCYFISLSAKVQISGMTDFGVQLSSGKIPHALRDIYYHSNHFSWRNDFGLYEQHSLKAGIYLNRYRLSLETENYLARNEIFYREDFLPQAYAKELFYGRMIFKNEFHFGKFGLLDHLEYGYSGNENVVRMPAVGLFGSLFYRNQLFKNALGFRAGIDGSWYSAYKGYGYMPATGVFYLQQEKEAGGYFMGGLFVNLKIKTADILIRVDHLNAGFFTRNYYRAAGYPTAGRTLKIGIRWKLSN